MPLHDDDPWKLVYTDYEPETEGLREALCALGNGRFVTRGASTDARADDVHYPGTYLAGGYNRAASQVGDRIVVNEDLVNLPNWLPLTFRPAGGSWYRIDDVDVLEHRVELDLRTGILGRSTRSRDRDGRTTTLTERRLVSMAEPHLAAVELTIEPEDWGGPVEIRSAIDGTVTNAGVKRYRALNSQHLHVLETGGDGGADDVISLLAETTASRVRVATAARTRVVAPEALPVEHTRIELPGIIEQRQTCEATAGVAIRIEKVVSLRTSRDRPSVAPMVDAHRDIAHAPDFARLATDHRTVWTRMWEASRLEFQGSAPRSTLICNLHLFQLNQTYSDHTTDIDAGVPARGWHGEAYRGHIFWDELFILPFLDYRFPERSEAALLYRYRRLDEARRAAKAEGYRGAMFPWQSGSAGEEETQTVHLNPKSGRWLPDGSHLQRHVNLAIAYNVWHHWLVTNDREFLVRYGAEMLLSIARFWSSAATWDENLGRWRILGVMGPDEYHEHLPGRDAPGLDDNAYTNVMASWTLRRALDVLDLLPEARCQELQDRLGVDASEIDRWRQQAGRLYVPIGDDGIISQFEGWDDLPEFDWDGYRARYGDISRLDRILEAEGDSADNYKLSKQADTLMLLYLLSADEVIGLLDDLGYECDGEMLRRNVEYHLARTSHGSTLSRVVHAWILARSDRARSWHLYTDALESDVNDIQGGTTAEGIHLGAMVGTVDLAQRCFTGLRPTPEGLSFSPRLPDDVERLAFPLQFRTLWKLQVELNHDELLVEALSGPEGATIAIEVKGEVEALSSGKSARFQLRQPAAV
ncbi:MAG: glycosyl hydrolase family 65 protein [Actinomycetota bacterium]|nr:glycosyl hydrolase family 65 protein [Actinomycetota bacterium]